MGSSCTLHYEQVDFNTCLQVIAILDKEPETLLPETRLPTKNIRGLAN